MKFLIDECLTPDLVAIANNAGYEAHHVTRIGKQSEKDWELVSYAIENDFAMVTRNSKDFRGEDGKPGFLTREELHPGLICPNAYPMDRERMALLFAHALEFLRGDNITDLINQVLEVDHGEDEVTLRLYEAPPSSRHS
jgi:hypothetical protein